MNKKGNPKHYMYGTQTYGCWCGIKRRCLNKNDKGYKNYGGRGIKVCQRWMSFKNFFEDMGLRPEGLSIERIDNNGDYCPENCEWADSKTQNRNKRNIKKYRGKSIPEWADELGIKRRTLYNRIYDGMSWEKALSLKPRNSSGIIFDKGRKKYRAYANVNGKNKFIGRYDTIEEAKEARKLHSLLCTK